MGRRLFPNRLSTTSPPQAGRRLIPTDNKERNKDGPQTVFPTDNQERNKSGPQRFQME